MDIALITLIAAVVMIFGFGLFVGYMMRNEADHAAHERERAMWAAMLRQDGHP